MDSNPPARIELNWKWTRALCVWSCCVFTVLGLACSPDDVSNETSSKDETSLSIIYKFTSDTSHYFSTSHEGKFVSNTNYLYKPNLEHLPWHLGDWKGWTLQSDDSNILYHRFYENENSGTGIFLMAVYGTNESQFHTPEVCYIGDGWKIEERRFKSINLRNEVFQVRYSVAVKEDMKHLVLYWYLWPDSRRNITDGLVMFRLSVSIDTTLEDAEKGALEFIKELSESKLEPWMKGDEVAETFTPGPPKSGPREKNPFARNGPPTRKKQLPGSSHRLFRIALSKNPRSGPKKSFDQLQGSQRLGGLSLRFQ